MWGVWFGLVVCFLFPQEELTPLTAADANTTRFPARRCWGRPRPSPPPSLPRLPRALRPRGKGPEPRTSPVPDLILAAQGRGPGPGAWAGRRGSRSPAWAAPPPGPGPARTCAEAPLRFTPCEVAAAAARAGEQQQQQRRRRQPSAPASLHTAAGGAGDALRDASMESRPANSGSGGARYGAARRGGGRPRPLPQAAERGGGVSPATASARSLPRGAWEGSPGSSAASPEAVATLCPGWDRGGGGGNTRPDAG